MITLQKAKYSQINEIWEIIQFAILSRKKDGSKQWQDGYPNLDTIKNDIDNQWAYVLIENEQIMAYAAIIFEREPAYEKIDGEWLNSDAYIVLHRIAVSKQAKGRGIATKLLALAENLASTNNVHNIKIDTNFDNLPMLHIIKKLGYEYCGEVYFRGDARKAFQKILN